MKNLLRIVFAILLLSSLAHGLMLFQTRPTGTVISGATSGGSAVPILTGSDGTVYVNASSTGSFTVTSNVNTGGSVATAQPVYIGGVDSGNLFPMIACGQSVIISQASTGATQLVGLSANKTIYVCSFSFYSAGTTNARLITATTSSVGLPCSAGATSITGNFNMTANGNIAQGNGLGMVTKGVNSGALCVVNSASVEVDGLVTYTQF